MIFKDYYQVRDWLESFIPHTYSKKNLGLARIRNLLKLLGNPQNKFKSILVAGTSGKGSTAFYIAKLLENSKKLRIGLHLSPHLVDIRERMQIFSYSQGFDPVSEKDYDHETGSLLMPMSRFLRLFDGIKPVVEKIQREKLDLTPSYFEILVAGSFLYFAKEKVDYAVVEVGLGGRLDATNVLEPEICVITNIGLDHTDILGKSIEAIAGEKAGIIKERVPVVTGVRGKALEVIKNVAKSKKSQLINFNTLSTKKGSKTDVSRYINRSYYLFRYTDDSFASQNINLALFAFLTLMSLRRNNLKMGEIATTRQTGLAMTIDRDVVEKAFSESFPGRFEEIDRNIIVDGAHNADKIKFLIRQLNTKYSIQNTQYTLVVAFKKGKNWQKMVDILVKSLQVKKIIATKFYAATDTGLFAAVEPKEIAKYVNSKWRMVNGKSSDNSQAAVFETLNANSLDANQLILVTGSLYLVGEVRTLWYLPEFSV